MSLALIALSFGAGFLMLPVEENAPLHYNVYFGIDLLGDSYLIFLVPTAVTVLAILNTIVGLMLWRHDRIIGYFMTVGTLMIAIVGATATGLIVNLSN